MYSGRVRDIRLHKSKAPISLQVKLCQEPGQIHGPDAVSSGDTGLLLFMLQEYLALMTSQVINRYNSECETLEGYRRLTEQMCAA